jgi:hypothetical protein
MSHLISSFAWKSMRSSEGVTRRDGSRETRWETEIKVVELWSVMLEKDRRGQETAA